MKRALIIFFVIMALAFNGISFAEGETVIPEAQTEVQPEVQAEPEAEAAPVETKKCTNCQADLVAGAAFCSNCGSAVPVSNGTESGITEAGAWDGSIVTYGCYEQDGNSENGAEEIEWIVLNVSDGKALLMSKYALDVKPYNNYYTKVTWETCSLRDWLNNAFYNIAFSAEEKAGIVSMNLYNDDNPTYRTSGGNYTTDNVFILSYTEANRYVPSGYCKAAPTAYAQKSMRHPEGSARWWLRTPAKYNDDVLYVSTSGAIYSAEGQRVDGGDGDFLVRPCIWVKVEAEQSRDNGAAIIIRFGGHTFTVLEDNEIWNQASEYFGEIAGQVTDFASKIDTILDLFN